MRRLIKFVHTVSSIGLTGGLAAYMLILSFGPEIDSIDAYAALRHSLAQVSKWLLLPSMLISLVSGLLSLVAHHPFQNAAWVWLKALLSLLIFEATLASIDTPARDAARLASQAIEAGTVPATLAELATREWTAYWIILALCIANVALGIWRPVSGAQRRRLADQVLADRLEPRA